MITAIKKAHDSLSDLESKKIFINRLNYNITGNFEYMSEIVDEYVKGVKNNFSWETLFENMKNIDSKTKIIIYGAGGEGDSLYWILKAKGITVNSFCDRNIGLNGSKEIPVISPKNLFDEYKQGKSIAIIIGTEMYFREIYDFLIENQIQSKDIYGGTADVDKQYFDRDLIKLNNEEVFVDCGALDLQTTRNFLNRCNSGKVYAFEPDKSNFERCMELKKRYKLKNVELYNYGCGEKNETLRFTSTQNGSSYVNDVGNTEISVVTLDEKLKSKRVTFIKMDIEGMEMEALHGAKKIIKEQKPKMAISIYHKIDDLVCISLLIKNLVPEYKIYIRHYSIYPAETILYATI